MRISLRKPSLYSFKEPSIPVRRYKETFSKIFEKVISKEFVFYTVFKMSTQEGRQARKIRIIAKTVHNQVVIRLLFSSRQNRINPRTFKEVSIRDRVENEKK